MDPELGAEEKRQVLRQTRQPASPSATRKALSVLYAKGGVVIPCRSAVTVYQAEGDQWVVVDHGLPTIIAKQTALQLCVHDVVNGEKVCEFQITESSGYRMDRDYFHSFVCVDEWDAEETYGLSFAEETVGKAAGIIILQLIPHARSLASANAEGEVEMDQLQGEAPQPSSDMEGQVSTDQGITRPPSAQKGGRVWKNIRHFFSSNRQSGGRIDREAEREQKKREISSPFNFQHISHGGGPIMYSRTQPVEPLPSVAPPPTSRTGRKRRASAEDPPSKKKKMEISEPKDFRHVSHVGAHTFGFQDMAGQEGVHTVLGGEEEEGEEAVDKRASSVRPSSVVSLDISEPFDLKHLAHVDKSDPLVQLLTGQSSKAAHEASGVNSGAADTAPQCSTLAKPINSNKDIELSPTDHGGSQTGVAVAGSEIKAPQEPAHKPAVLRAQSEGTEQPGMECGPVLCQSQSSLFGQDSTRTWSETSQSSSQDTERQTSTEGPPTSEFDHGSFMDQIESFDPSQLRKAEDRELPRAPPSHRLSMQTMMRSSFDKMKEKLHSVWRESVFAYIAEEDEFGDEEFDFGGLI